MAWLVAGAVAAGMLGLGAAINPSKEEAEDASQRMFNKPYSTCTRSERTAIDIAVGGPKLSEMRDRFQSLFPKPKVFRPANPFAARQSEDEESFREAQPSRKTQGKPADKEYYLHEDPDIKGVYNVHQDTADPAYEYEARFEDLKHLVPFDIDTESYEEVGTYDVQELVSQSAIRRIPEPFTLPRQLGGAATSANLLINKLTSGEKLGFPDDYVMPGYAIDDAYQPPSDSPADVPPPEAMQDIRSLVDYRLSRGIFAPTVYMSRVRTSAAAGSSEETDEDETEWDEDESEDAPVAPCPVPVRAVVPVQRTAAPPPQTRQVVVPPRQADTSSEYEDESESDD